MAPVAFVVMAIAATVGFVGAIMQADADKGASDFNADLYDRDAAMVENQTIEEERIFRVNARQELGDIRASYGASGISSSEGSAAEVIRMSASNAELDAYKIREQGRIKARALRDSATQTRRYGAAKETSDKLGAFGGLLSAGGKMAAGSGGK